MQTRYNEESLVKEMGEITGPPKWRRASIVNHPILFYPYPVEGGP